MQVRTFLFFAMSLLAHSKSMAQGCSDAGVCTAGPIGQLATKSDSTGAKEPLHFARLQFSYAVGEQGIVIMQVVPEIGIGITDGFGLQLKVPYVSASGNLGDNSGIGDVIFTASYAFVKERDHNLTAIAGLRLPTGETSPQPLEQTSFGPDFKPLPMPYQPGLGTLDLLLGAQYRYKRWTTALAYQHVLDQGNENLFYHEAWDGDADALTYFESAYLERANDAVARVQYALPIGKFSIQPGLLAIYHLGLDSRLELDGTPDPWEMEPFVRRDVEGSDGLTLNLTAEARYDLSDSWSLEASFGSAVITREARPDGLTRAMVINLGVRFAF
ncbi:MAG: hypothetical protein IPG10_17200 [Flavobacteriales bacterium]|jgi:hypothetical protein|nr:hypothetical protein [Flavobacteriales bacterium]MBK6755320.1 hypothetical protein [Flavobacteriales bacterium]MBK7269443.1 hypothetical protein [Flavobacteriales bacterium]MBK9075126.1 hypothetical protein [Flavobacteriales bacterium]MBK9540313.1 hypothetical protein [Flavobacteriales bacterium]